MNKHRIATAKLAAVCLGCIAAPALAAPPCSAQTTRGTWMYTCEGTLPAPAQTATRILAGR
jgi:hypothetical protein